MSIRWPLGGGWGWITSGRSMCPFCPDTALDPLGHHAVTCRHGGDVDIRHNRLRDEVFDLCRRAYLSVSVEEVMVSPETLPTPGPLTSLLLAGTEANLRC